MSEISKIWYNEVRTLAISCILDKNYIKLITIDKSKLTDSEKTYIEEINIKYYDACGMYFISNMIKEIDKALDEKADSKAYLYVDFAYSIFNSPNYLKSTFEGNNTCNEWETRMKLKDGLKKIIDLNA